MTHQEAYKLICEHYKDEPVVRSCREWPEYFGFYLAPKGTPKDAKVFVGGNMSCVDKNTKEIFSSEVFTRRPMFPIKVYGPEEFE